jgi:hypothetical protein
LIFLKTTEIRSLKEKLLDEQGGVCLISGMPIFGEIAVLDHKHKLFKDQPLGEDNAGFCRGVLHRSINSWEGKVFNAYRRLGLHKIDKTLPELLRSLADYLEREPTEYIHPREVPKEPKIGKREFAKLNKLYKEKYPNRKQLEYPSSGKWTNVLKELAEEINQINPISSI